MKIEGKVALITGAASGIGYAIAQCYLEAGGRVVSPTSTRRAPLALRRSWRGRMQLSASAWMSPRKIRSMQALSGRYKHSARSIFSSPMPASRSCIQSRSSPSPKKMLAIHLDGAFLATKACIKHMYKQGSGSLIYMGSVHSHEASPLKAAYVAAKHGLLGLSRVMAREGAKYNVRANVICPGFVKTPLVDKQIPEQAQELGISEERVIKEVLLAETVDHKFTTVEDVAEVALFLAAFKTNALTGQSICVSHGWHMS